MNTAAAALSILTVVLLAAQAGAQSPAEQLHAIFDDHYNWRLHEFPEEAMSHGDYSHADRVTDNSLAAIERRHGQTQGFLDRLHHIDRAVLSEPDVLNYDLFELELRNSIDGHRFRMFLAPVGGRFGPQTDIAQMHERVRFNTRQDYLNYLQRLRQVPTTIDNTIALMKLGLTEKRTPSRVTMEGLPKQFQDILSDGLNELATPLDRMPGDISPEDGKAIRARFKDEVMPAVHNAIDRLGRYVVDEYMPRCRESIAASALPDGADFYAYQLRVFTTTDMTARQIFELGQSEVARIRKEMMQVIRASDYLQLHPAAASLSDQELFMAFLVYLRTDSRFYHASESDLLTGYRDICKRVDAELPKLFRRLPRLTYGVKPIPTFMAPTQTTAYYSEGDIRNAEPGYFYANTYALDQRPKYEMIPLALHESVPGHHLQISLAQELEGLPEFRKNAYFVAFGEGWALYSERLGIEMGFYKDPYNDFGRLLYEMWRACRLVVDPGMHAMGWSRDQAIQFMRDNTALSELNIANEIDRYINWPGQATAYKIGELKIRELRARAEKALGERFDIRAFHDVVLGAGALPLPVLERRVNEWIGRK